MKIYRITAGTFGGGVISAFCLAIISWIIIIFSDAGFEVEGPNPAWAYFAAVIGATIGLILGLPLGLLISLVNQGRIVGTFFGSLEGLVLVIWGSQLGGHPDIVYPTIPLLVSFVPAGALSGFLTSVLVSRLSEQEPAKL